MWGWLWYMDRSRKLELSPTTANKPMGCRIPPSLEHNLFGDHDGCALRDMICDSALQSSYRGASWWLSASGSRTSANIMMTLSTRSIVKLLTCSCENLSLACRYILLTHISQGRWWLSPFPYNPLSNCLMCGILHGMWKCTCNLLVPIILFRVEWTKWAGMRAYLWFWSVFKS